MLEEEKVKAGLQLQDVAPSRGSSPLHATRRRDHARRRGCGASCPPP